jgi:hypothetical protein
MRAPSLRLLLASSLVLAATPWPANAQFGLPGMPRVGRILPLPGPGRVLGRGLPGLPFGKFRRAFGIIGAVAVGSVILGRLSRRDGAEVTRRTRVALDKSPDQEVTDTYQTSNGNAQVTITAGPAQKAAGFKGDPVLRQTADAIQQSGDDSASTGKAAAKPMNDVLRIDEIPEDTQCRKVTTEMETKSGGRKGESKTDSKTTNVSILCQLGADWKPASA